MVKVRAANRSATGISTVLWSAAIALSACGGGGRGGDDPAAAPAPPPAPSAYEAARIPVRGDDTPCESSTSTCALFDAVFVNEAGVATLFWEEDPTGKPAWHVAAHRPGEPAVSERVFVSEPLGHRQIVPLDSHRFAVLTLSNDLSEWVSNVVDSSTATPTVSPQTRTSLAGHIYPALIASEGRLYAVATGISARSYPLDGSGTAAQGVLAKLPPDWGHTGAAATSVMPSAWWAYIAGQPSVPGYSVQLSRLDFESGTLTPPEARSTGELPHPGELTIGEHAIGQVTVGWLEHSDDGSRNVRVDGQRLNAAGTVGKAGPVLGGSQAGPVVAWEEGAAGENTAWGQRLVWQHKDLRTGAWSLAAPLSSSPKVRTLALAAGPRGTMAIAWTGCTETGWDCASHVSRFVDGAWHTTQFTDVYWAAIEARVAINSKGEGVVAWLGQAVCPSNPKALCDRLSIHRF